MTTPTDDLARLREAYVAETPRVPPSWSDVSRRVARRRVHRRTAVAAAVGLVALLIVGVAGLRRSPTDASIAAGNADTATAPDASRGTPVSRKSGFVVSFPVGFAPTGRPELASDADGTRRETRRYASEDGRQFTITAYDTADPHRKLAELTGSTSTPDVDMTVLAAPGEPTVVATIDAGRLIVVSGQGVSEEDLMSIATSTVTVR